MCSEEGSFGRIGFARLELRLGEHALDLALLGKLFVLGQFLENGDRFGVLTRGKQAEAETHAGMGGLFVLGKFFQELLILLDGNRVQLAVVQTVCPVIEIQCRVRRLLRLLRPDRAQAEDKHHAPFPYHCIFIPQGM